MMMIMLQKTYWLSVMIKLRMMIDDDDDVEEEDEEVALFVNRGVSRALEIPQFHEKILL